MAWLDGRVAVITGGGRGIGREHALLFGAEGASVVVNDLGGAADGSGADTSAAQSVVDEITAAGGRAVALHFDVTQTESTRAALESALASGPIQILVNNAGITVDAVLPGMRPDQWHRVIDVSVNGFFNVTQSLLMP
ncbi:MAG: SDR family NAD(P)-dependent oxidoreductase, partial [Candidatus Dormibacteria bacterium]